MRSEYLLVLLAVAASGCATRRNESPPSTNQAALVAASENLDAESIGRVAGAKPTISPDGVVRLSWPRQDVPIVIDGVALPSAAGLSSWAAFAPSPAGAMLMSDTVVFEDEVDEAMDAAFAHGLEVTGLHNHFFFDRPNVYFMHLGGMGDPEELASGVKAVWDAIRGVRQAAPTPAHGFGGETPSRGEIPAADIARIVGHPAPVQDGVAKVTVAREGSMHGTRVGGSMGLATWAAFTGTAALAVMDGDFIMVAAEVQPVLRALRVNGIHVVALHNHMIGESPPFYFTHFWAKGPAAKLAAGFRAALDSQANTNPADARP